jgi:hypothetical protein
MDLTNGGKMLYLIQIMHMLNKKDREALAKLFSDLSFELYELGYEHDPESLIDDLLQNHFGIEMEDPKQLAWLTEWVVENQNRPSIFESAVKTVNLQKGVA